MMPVLEVKGRVAMAASSELRLASSIVLASAEALADDLSDAREASRFLLVADRLSALLESPTTPRQRFLEASPSLVEQSGRHRTLIEMVEADQGDYSDRLRLAKVLFRALIWRPETFPYRRD